ncbi:MAG: Lpg1974 family pore-forming outer membrane protein, partial [Parachlamydiales bacterium]
DYLTRYDVDTDNGRKVPRAYNYSRSWLLGPRIGLNTEWLFGAGFGMRANGAAALFYQHFKETLKRELLDNPPAIASYYKSKQGFINPSLEAALGFGWGSYLGNRCCHLDLSAFYEFKFFFNQNMLGWLNGTVSNLDAAPNDLSFQGLTINLRFDF